MVTGPVVLTVPETNQKITVFEGLKTGFSISATLGVDLRGASDPSFSRKISGFIEWNGNLIEATLPLDGAPPTLHSLLEQFVGTVESAAAKWLKYWFDDYANFANAIDKGWASLGNDATQVGRLLSGVYGRKEEQAASFLKEADAAMSLVGRCD